MLVNKKKTRLLSLFNTLEEKDKDIVIFVSESLVKKHEINTILKTNNFHINKAPAAIKKESP